MLQACPVKKVFLFINLLPVEEGNFFACLFVGVAATLRTRNLYREVCEVHPLAESPNASGLDHETETFSIPIRCLEGGSPGDDCDTCLFTFSTAYFPLKQAGVVALGGGA